MSVTCDIRTNRNGSNEVIPATQASHASGSATPCFCRIGIPLDERNAEADIVRRVVIVDEALAVAAEVLKISLQLAVNRERPVQLDRAVRTIPATERMAELRGNLVTVPVACHEQFAAAHVVLDVRIVV